MFRTNAIPASKRATQTSWQRTVQAQGMNSARRATELALILIKAAPLRGTAARRQRLGLYDGTPGRTPGRNLAH
jgi:hypothetical protein